MFLVDHAPRESLMYITSSEGGGNAGKQPPSANWSIGTKTADEIQSVGRLFKRPGMRSHPNTRAVLTTKQRGKESDIKKAETWSVSAHAATRLVLDATPE